MNRWNAALTPVGSRTGRFTARRIRSCRGARDGLRRAAAAEPGGDVVGIVTQGEVVGDPPAAATAPHQRETMRRLVSAR